MSCTPVIPVLGLRQEDWELEANLAYGMSSRVESKPLSLKVRQTTSDTSQESKAKTPKE